MVKALQREAPRVETHNESETAEAGIDCIEIKLIDVNQYFPARLEVSRHRFPDQFVKLMFS